MTGLHPDFRAVLFDIDGTLLRATRRSEYREEMCAMLRRIFGTEGELRRVDFAGRTDLSIYREALETHGFTVEDIRTGLPQLKAASVEIVDRMSREGEVFRLCAGVRPLLEAVSGDGRFVCTLLTGNLEDLAMAKLRSVGLAQYFPVRGAYGSDAEDRNRLPAIAAQRFGDQLGRDLPPDRMIIVGDTPRDIECARHHGARSVAVASGFHTLDQLRSFQPDALLPDLADTEAVLRILRFVAS